jgi:hypothetical protein
MYGAFGAVDVWGLCCVYNSEACDESESKVKRTNERERERERERLS